MLTAWRYPLYHIITELSYMEQAPDEIISRARNIEEKIIVLIEALRGILSKVCTLIFLCFLSFIREVTIVIGNECRPALFYI
jgi:hypothetical protein